MSNLTKSIRDVKTDARKICDPLYAEVTKVEESFTACPFYMTDVAALYRIGVTFQQECFISESLTVNARNNVVAEHVKAAKMNIVEAVFGEFRPHFRMIEIALAKRDIGTAVKLLRKFELEMYEV